MKHLVESALFIITAISLVACKDAPESNPLVTNGSATQYGEAIVELSFSGGACTGTFVNPNTLITAGHCVMDNNGRLYQNLNVGGIKAKSVFSQYTGKIEDSNTDVAIVVFPNQTAHRLGIHDFSHLSNKEPEIGEEVVAIGFGQNDIQAGIGAGQKRFGTNKITQSEGGLISFFGQSRGQGSGTNVGLGPGDSGGPLLRNDGYIIGINSYIAADGSGSHRSYCAATSSSTSQRLFRDALDAGAESAGWFFGAGAPSRYSFGADLATMVNQGHYKLVVRAIQPNSPASILGLLPNDQITVVDQIKIGTAEDFLMAMNNSTGKAKISIIREGQNFNGEVVFKPTRR
jgi:S1-C subfamily serine protease